MAQLTLQEFEHLFGLPARVRAPLRPEVIEMFEEIKQNKKRRIPFPELEQTIRKGIKTLSDELPFLQAFILYTIGCILCPTTQRWVSVDYMPYVVSREAILVIDLARLSLNHLVKSVKQYNAALKDPERGLQGIVNLEGNLPLLQFWFWEKFRLDRLDASIDYTGREAPLLQYWDEKKARKVCAILNEHGRDAGEYVFDLKEAWEPPRPSSPLPSFDDLPPTDSKLVLKLHESILNMRRAVMHDNLLTRIKIEEHGDYLYRFEEKLDAFCQQRANVRLKLIEMHHSTFPLHIQRSKIYAWIHAGLR
nr:uncharacterized protein LOC127345644 [Lolium perenne]